MNRTGNPKKVPVGISSCLLGAAVRYDGGHKYDALINTQLAELFEFHPSCPEMAIGLGVPRAPVQLVRTERGIRVRGVQNPALDVTRELQEYGTSRARELGTICGYIFKSGSPSCGMAGVATWTVQGVQAGLDSSGAFAAALLSARPDLPVTDEVHLQDPRQRVQFIEAVFARYRRAHGYDVRPYQQA
jgi:uncharacterized protein YbbK (DUF523 family)